MSTRSLIVVTGSGRYNSVETFVLYKHSDGYPTGNLPIIEEAFDNTYETQKLIRLIEALEFKVNPKSEK